MIHSKTCMLYQCIIRIRHISGPCRHVHGDRPLSAPAAAGRRSAESSRSSGGRSWPPWGRGAAWPPRWSASLRKACGTHDTFLERKKNSIIFRSMLTSVCWQRRRHPVTLPFVCMKCSLLLTTNLLLLNSCASLLLPPCLRHQSYSDTVCMCMSLNGESVKWGLAINVCMEELQQSLSWNLYNF